MRVQRAGRSLPFKKVGFLQSLERLTGIGQAKLAGADHDPRAATVAAEHLKGIGMAPLGQQRCRNEQFVPRRGRISGIEI